MPFTPIVTRPSSSVIGTESVQSAFAKLNSAISALSNSSATIARTRFSSSDGNLVANQTSFSVPAYTPGTVQVFYNGLSLVAGIDFTATSGSNVVLSSGVLPDSASTVVIEVLSINAAGVANAAPLVHTHVIADINGLQAALVAAANSASSATVSRTQFSAAKSNLSAAQQSFTVPTYTPGTVQVFYNGLSLVAGLDFTATSGSTVVLSAGVDATSIIEVLSINANGVANAAPLVHTHVIADINGLQAALTAAASTGSTATVSRTQFSAAKSNLSAAQQSFNVPNYTPGTVQVFYNGIALVAGTDFTATTGTTVVLSTGADIASIVEVLSLNAAGVANAAPLVHTHAISDVVGLQNTLSTKSSGVTIAGSFFGDPGAPVYHAAILGGVVGNTGADQTTALQAAVNAMPATGGRLILPPGAIIISSKILISRSRVSIEGASMYATTIVSSVAFDKDDVFYITGNYSGIRNLSFEHASSGTDTPFRRAGFTINLANGYGFINDVSIRHACVGIRMGAVGGYQIVNTVVIEYCADAVTVDGAGGILVDNTAIGPENWIENVIIKTNAEGVGPAGVNLHLPGFGVKIVNSGATHIEGLDATGLRNSLQLVPSTVAAILSAGSGYAVGDTIVISGGTLAASGTAFTCQVTSVNAGAVTSIRAINPGQYTSIQTAPNYPANSYAQASTSGGGTGATFKLTSQTVQATLGTNCFFDGSQGDNVVIAPSGTGYVFHAAFTNCWITNTQQSGTNGLRIGGASVAPIGSGRPWPIMKVSWSGGTIANTAGQQGTGVLIADALSADIMVMATTISGWSYGINVAAGASHIVISQNAIGAYGFFDVPAGGSTTSRTNTAGINVTAGSGDWIRINDNNLYANATAAITFSATGNNCRVHKNAGHNPFGPSNVTLAASPMTLPVSAYDVTYFGKDGTTSYVRDGSGMITYYTNAAQWNVFVPAGSQIVWAYTGSPTLTRLVH